ncbi:MAG: CrcB family protein [Bdellovibrionaceae bacterium]|nr:CrcB family protein [Pseudobdellovibrionaceae bacterium]
MQGLNIVIGIFILGGLGAFFRYMVGAFFMHSMYGVLAVNVIASFFAGVLSFSTTLSSPYKLVIIFGLLGSFSTFSSYALQVHQLLLEGQWLRAGVVFIANNLLSILACYLGYKLALNL